MASLAAMAGTAMEPIGWKPILRVQPHQHRDQPFDW